MIKCTEYVDTTSRSQGQKSGSNMQCCFAYKSWTNDFILIMLINMRVKDIIRCSYNNSDLAAFFVHGWYASVCHRPSQIRFVWIFLVHVSWLSATQTRPLFYVPSERRSDTSFCKKNQQLVVEPGTLPWEASARTTELHSIHSIN